MTSGQLIALLNKYPPDTEVGIDDPDTGWRLALTTVTLDAEGVVCLGATYLDAFKGNR